MHQLEIDRHQQEGITVLFLSGPFTLGHPDLRFRDELEGLLKAGSVRVVLNLQHLTTADSAGIGTMLFAKSKLEEAGGKLALADLQTHHVELILLAKLETVFQIFKTQQDAINSFFPDRAVQHYDILDFVRERDRQGSK